MDELLYEIINQIPPEKLGELVASVMQPQSIQGGQFNNKAEGLRATLPVQMPQVRGGIHGVPRDASRPQSPMRMRGGGR